MKKRYYIVDKLTQESARKICSIIVQAINEIHRCEFDYNQSMIIITSKKNMEAQLRSACDVVGAVLRTEFKP